MNIPPEKQTLLDTIVELLSAVTGVQALVLGGSYARGTQRPDSDLDVALYYREDQPFDLDEIRGAASAIVAGDAPQVTAFYGWGPWVNGGAWIHTPVGKVDFLYRNIDQVQRTIDEARQGITHHDFNQQPAYGFYSVIYLAETHVCFPLYDPHGIIARLKEQVAVYPPELKKQTLASALWLAEFSLLHADGFGASGNVYAAAGALTRAASYMTQALFAINETYFISDKSALNEIAAFARAPRDYGARLSRILGQVGQTREEMAASVSALRGLWREVVDLSGGYTPAFQV